MLTGRAVVADLGKSFPISLKPQRIDGGPVVGQTLGRLLAELGQTERHVRCLKRRGTPASISRSRPTQIAALLAGG